MKTKDFSFSLPEELVAQEPSERRGESRLLLMDRSTGALQDAMVSRLADFLDAGTLMVFNDSRVRKARVEGLREKDGKLYEFLLTARRGQGLWEAMVKRARSFREGEGVTFPAGKAARVAGHATDGLIVLRFEDELTEEWLEAHGHVPLPPYIRRPDSRADAERYQTVYARSTGSSAAPTAGLHFTDELLERLDEKGVERCFVTLHVGLGTFLPVRSEDIESHRMHEEEYSVPEETAAAILRARREGRKILAVGTTSLRTLESAWDAESSGVVAGPGRTDIFITPGYRFKAVDALFTNFHTPESTLLMLVSAFAGRERILDAYQEAVKRRYRFFSYGDAMLIGDFSGKEPGSIQ